MTATGRLVTIDGIEQYRIDAVEDLDPFLTTVVSDTDLWMFVSSNGALTAGRVDADHALFPYLTDDRLHRSVGRAGPVTVIAREADGARELWRPFHSERDPGCTRSLAKSVHGDRLVFEEHNEQWGLRFRATWAPADSFGWVRTVEVADAGGGPARLEIVDGFLDVMPAGVDVHTEQTRSNLADAYKRSETGSWGTLAVYTIEALIIDRAEPGESLTATAVWSFGFDGATVHLDERAFARFRDGRAVEADTLVTGRPGAYLLSGEVDVPVGGSTSWSIVADTGLVHSRLLDLSRQVGDAATSARVMVDIDAGADRLASLLEGADGHQSTADPIADAHHLSNVLFNCMRGGVFPFGADVPTADLLAFIRGANQPCAERQAAVLDGLAGRIAQRELRRIAESTGDPDLIRLVLEYLPLTFSRRHGDPSRPWNRFAIHVRDDLGNQVLSYEGNWRDIFQNWEALLASFPDYHANVVAKFVNASTVDGYNPYRISREGVDWEVPEPDDPWSNIGYWGDHQIVYLLRLLEAWNAHEPGAVSAWMNRPWFTYADVPYTLADHDDLVADPRNTIEYDDDRAARIVVRETTIGSDGRLVCAPDGDLVRVGFGEKLIVPALAKLCSFVPGGGIWMNTQRPEWNDANNALAGPGSSLVTLYHLRRYLAFLSEVLADADEGHVDLTWSVAAWLSDVRTALESAAPGETAVDDRLRRALVDTLGGAAERHRHRVRSGLGDIESVAVGDVIACCETALAHLDTAVRNGRRDDGLYDSYNLVEYPDADRATVSRLGPMLEGQVAVLSSGVLAPAEAADLVDLLYGSSLHRGDVDSFMLYPAVSLASFLDRNVIAESASFDIAPETLDRIVDIDADGRMRFRSHLVSEALLVESLDELGATGEPARAVIEAYEDVFHQRSFTGRSSSMYGYEGIGSVYWHMVAKLLVAVQELYWMAVDAGESEVTGRLAESYRRIRNGLGFRREPGEYGAFPTDCYSHTPHHSGAQQPGMTGQVKEEILARLGELGVRVVDGRIAVSPGLLPAEEIMPGDEPVRFTMCGVPMTLAWGRSDMVEIAGVDGVARFEGRTLDTAASNAVFARTGEVERVDWIMERMERPG